MEERRSYQPRIKFLNWTILSLVLATILNLVLISIFQRPTAHETTMMRVYQKHPEKLYGHVHMAKSGGTSLNGILANNFERVCGHKGYSYDAYRSNERAKKDPRSIDMTIYSRDRVKKGIMLDIGFEDCDYISMETDYSFWSQFSNSKFHGIPMELHITCRDPVDHLLSQCNHDKGGRGRIILNCTSTDEEFLSSVRQCLLFQDRYHHSLKDGFDVKCINYEHQFTTYIDYIGKVLQPRRFVSSPYIIRETNTHRDKEQECIWNRPDLIEKTKEYLVGNFEYFQFCNSCMGSEDEL